MKYSVDKHSETSAWGSISRQELFPRFILLLLVFVPYLPEYTYRQVAAALIILFILTTIIYFPENSVITKGIETYYFSAFAGIIALTIPSWYVAVNIGDAIKFSGMSLLLTVYAFFLCRYSKNRINSVIETILLIALIMAVFNILQHITGKYWISKVDYSERDAFFGLPLPHPRHSFGVTSFAEYAALLIYPVPYVMRRFKWITALFIVVVLGGGIYFTGLRSAYFAFYIVVLTSFLMIKYKQPSFKYFILLAVAILVFGLMLTSTAILTEGTTIMRIKGYDIAYQEIINNPVLGHGDGTWEATYGHSLYIDELSNSVINSVSIHNPVLLLAYNAGVIPAVILLRFLYLLTRNGLKSGQLGKDTIVGFMSALFTLFFTPLLLSFTLFFLLGITMSAQQQRNYVTRP